MKRENDLPIQSIILCAFHVYFVSFVNLNDNHNKCRIEMIIKVINIECNHWFLNNRFDFDDIHEDLIKVLVEMGIRIF